MSCFTFFYSYYVFFKPQCGFYTYSLSQFVPAPLVVLSSHVWLVATILDGTYLGGESSKLIHIPP